ncbi:permease [Oscillospiraceae bacterium HV4-5-C5C]|nr:permease [Oscillospiraceae bacterium HV4-5-C5C]
MAAIPVYVVTGFLDAGKTTFINQLFNHPAWKGRDLLLLQFERGQAAITAKSGRVSLLQFSKRELEQPSGEIALRIGRQLALYQQQHGGTDYEEIWIEWNGVVPFEHLEALLLEPPLRRLCCLRKVFQIADADRLELLLNGTGGLLAAQLAVSDIVFLRNVKDKKQRRQLSQQIRVLNPGVAVQDFWEGLLQSRRKLEKRPSALKTLLGLAFLLLLAYGLIQPLLLLFGADTAVNTMVNIFLGIILQAFPFLLIGVLLSSAIQVLLPADFFVRHFPRTLSGGMVAALVAGFFLPVCDCASIPVFRSLIKKGIPLPAALTFLTATPVINPVVILSTYYAFNYDWSVVLERVCLGVIVSVLVGLTFALLPQRTEILQGYGQDPLLCSCGVYDTQQLPVEGWRGKLDLFWRHAQAEFFSVGKFLLIGTLAAAALQTWGSSSGFFSQLAGTGTLALTMLLLMLAAFAFSLCSSSDAVIARSLTNLFPHGAVLAFLVFGPMMDLKNLLLLQASFRRRFIVRLLLTVAGVCFLVVFGVFSLAGV